jgi:hypothetical protein
MSAGPTILPPDVDAAGQDADIRVRLEWQGYAIGGDDVFIPGHTRDRGLGRGDRQSR